MLLQGLRETRLENGLTLLLLEDRTAPVFTLMLWVPVGARDERPGITGVSHYLEHCYSLGSSRYGPREVDRVVQSLGGQKNAFTSYDYTAYYASLPAGSLERIAEVEADRFATLALPEERLRSELDVVREERRLRYENAPAGRLSEMLLAASFEKHPYGKPVIGTAEDLARMKRDDVVAWYRAHYVPSNATYVLVGDFDPEGAVALFRRLFGGLPAGERPRSSPEPEPEQEAERRVEACMPSLRLPRVSMLWKVPPLDHADTAALEVLATALFDGDSARLDRVLRRERRLVGSIGGGHWECRDAGPFTLEAEALEGVPVEEIEAAVDEALAEIAREGPTDAEVRRAQAQLELAFLAGLESTSSRARTIGRLHVTSARGVRTLEDYVARVRAATREDLRRVAATYLVRSRRTVARLLPPKPASSSAHPERSAAAGRAESKGPDPEKVPAAPETPLGEPWGEARRWAPAGGPVVLHQRVERLPTVAIAIQSRGGSACDPRGKAGLSTAVLECLRCGTTSQDEDAVAARFADLGSSLGSARGPDCASLGATVLARDFEKALELLADVARRPAFPEDKLERVRNEMLAEKASSRARAEDLLIDAFYATLYAGHPYETPINGTPEGIAAISRDDLARFHAERWRPDGLTIAVVGAVAPSRVRAGIERWFGGGASAAAPRAPEASRLPASRPRLTLVDKPDQTQAHLRAGLPAIGRGDPEHDALSLANVVVGGGGLASRIPDIVRTRNGLAYSAGSSLVQRALPAPFLVAAQTRLPTAAKAVELMLAEVARLGREPVPEEELARAKALFAGSLPFRLETNAQKAATLLEGELFGLGPDHLRRQIERIQALSAEELRAAAAARLRPEAMSIVVVGPRALLEEQLAPFANPREITA